MKSFKHLNPLRSYFLPFLMIAGLNLMTSITQAAEIQVTLLGQPCLLSGPFNDSTLQTIHSIGPAQLYPSFLNLNRTATREHLAKALSQIQNAKNLPTELSRYQQRLIHRWEKQLKFLQALQSKSPDKSLQRLGRDTLQTNDLAQFDALLRRKGLPTEQLFELFSDAIEPDPEAEFHRATKKLRIQYNCTFEESDPETPPAQKN